MQRRQLHGLALQGPVLQLHRALLREVMMNEMMMCKVSLNKMMLPEVSRESASCLRVCLLCCLCVRVLCTLSLLRCWHLHLCCFATRSEQPANLAFPYCALAQTQI
jgi:hypothetical protein